MAKFTLLYVGGDRPASEEEGAAVMGAWMAWFEKAGSALVDGGSAFGDSTAVGVDLPATGANGYSVIEAASAADATAMLADHPHLAANGRIEVHETLDM